MNLLIYKLKTDLLLPSGKIIPKDATIVVANESVYWRDASSTDSFHKFIDLAKEALKTFENTNYFERIY